MYTFVLCNQHKKRESIHLASRGCTAETSYVHSSLKCWKSEISMVNKQLASWNPHTNIFKIQLVVYFPIAILIFIHI